jgi:hypothetical protein
MQRRGGDWSVPGMSNRTVGRCGVQRAGERLEQLQ